MKTSNPLSYHLHHYHQREEGANATTLGSSFFLFCPPSGKTLTHETPGSVKTTYASTRGSALKAQGHERSHMCARSTTMKVLQFGRCLRGDKFILIVSIRCEPILYKGHVEVGETMASVRPALQVKQDKERLQLAWEWPSNRKGSRVDLPCEHCPAQRWRRRNEKWPSQSWSPHTWPYSFGIPLTTGSTHPTQGSRGPWCGQGRADHSFCGK